MCYHCTVLIMLLLWQHGDMTGTQVVHSYKCFSSEHIWNSLLFAISDITCVCEYNGEWRRTNCQVMTGVTSSWMSTVAPPFSSASTTCSWPSWHANIIAVQPSWSGMTTTGAHSDEEHELIPTVSKNGGSLFHRNVHHRNKTSHTVENGHTVCGSNYQFLGWMVEQMRKDSNIREYTMNLHATLSDLHSLHS